uniref:Uncharacterized protein n=1 Tax=Setaria italica TaxID=4555 RepID=K3YP30_SETIT
MYMPLTDPLYVVSIQQNFMRKCSKNYTPFIYIQAF